MKFYRNSGAPASGYGFGLGPGALSPFIKVMIIANVAVFILQRLVPDLTLQLGLVPGYFFADFPNRLYQPLTYMFLHAGFWHLFFNMFVLWMFGTEVELSWGTRSFGKFYVLAGVAGALLTLLVHSSQVSPTVGASAAIYGVLVAYWFMFPERTIYLFFILPMKVKWAIPGLMLVGFLAGGTGVAHMAHLGGALFAFVFLKSDWRAARLGAFFRGFSHRRKEARLQKNRQKAEDIMKRVDAILDKINEVGIENLTTAERKSLEEASSHLSEKKSPEEK